MAIEDLRKTIEELFEYFAINSGMNDWDMIDGYVDGVMKHLESYTNQQISKVVSEIEDKLPEKYYGRHDKNTYEWGYSEALDQVHKVLEGYKK